MNESDLTQELLSACRVEMRGTVAMKISDRFNSGYPDVTNTWQQMTSWWEVKFWDNGEFESPEIQHLTCRRLAAQGTCNYVVYEQKGPHRRVLIVRPDMLSHWQDSPDFTQGFNHLWVAKFIRLIHTVAPTHKR